VLYHYYNNVPPEEDQFDVATRAAYDPTVDYGESPDADALTDYDYARFAAKTEDDR
jgi:hypothetical protein